MVSNNFHNENSLEPVRFRPVPSEILDRLRKMAAGMAERKKRPVDVTIDDESRVTIEGATMPPEFMRYAMGRVYIGLGWVYDHDEENLFKLFTGSVLRNLPKKEAGTNAHNEAVAAAAAERKAANKSSQGEHNRRLMEEAAERRIHLEYVKLGVADLYERHRAERDAARLPPAP